MALPHGTIRVLVVDDSPLLRKVVKDILEKVPQVSFVETAPNGRIALKKIEKHDPDIVTMDVEMPELDGISVLKKIMETSPRPVIMLSAYTFEGAAKTIRALELGAVDFIQKPSGRLARDLKTVENELVEKVLAVAESQIENRRGVETGEATLTLEKGNSQIAGVEKKELQQLSATPGETGDIIAIGASTGGTEAIRHILTALPADFPSGILVVQHMPEGFTKAFSDRMNELSEIHVKEAKHKDLVLPGRALIAPGHSHMQLGRGDHGYFVDLNKRPEVNGHRPSVDVLFNSVAKTCGKASVGVLLTGMGRDGAIGMKNIFDAGGFTIAQDQKSCVVYGMPKAAIELGVAKKIVSLSRIPVIINKPLTGPENHDPKES